MRDAICWIWLTGWIVSLIGWARALHTSKKALYDLETLIDTVGRE